MHMKIERPFLSIVFAGLLDPTICLIFIALIELFSIVIMMAHQIGTNIISYR